MIKVANDTAQPKMTAIGYVGQSVEQLRADLALRREHLTPDPIEKERLKCVGSTPQGTIWIDLLSFMR